jgi:hypothetical protein
MSAPVVAQKGFHAASFVQERLAASKQNSIHVGQVFPDATLSTVRDGQIRFYSLGKKFQEKRILFLAFPDPFLDSVLEFIQKGSLFPNIVLQEVLKR